MRLNAKNPSPSRHHSGEPLTPEPGPGMLRWGARPASSYLPPANVRGTNAVHFSHSPSRIASSAGGLSLAALFAVAGAANAAPLPSFAYTLSAAVTGDARTGVWRVRMTSPLGDKRIEFVLRIGDVGWNGVVRVSRR